MDHSIYLFIVQMQCVQCVHTFTTKNICIQYTEKAMAMAIEFKFIIFAYEILVEF